MSKSVISVLKAFRWFNEIVGKSSEAVANFCNVYVAIITVVNQSILDILQILNQVCQCLHA